MNISARNRLKGRVVKFELEPGELIVQVSGSESDAVTLAVTPDR